MATITKPPITVDKLLEKPGWFYFVLAISQIFMFIVHGSSALHFVLFKAEGDWFCLDDPSVISSNGTDLDQCGIVESDRGCQNFNWTGQFHSIVPDYRLVCGRKIWIYVIMEAQAIGAFMGAFFCSQLSNKFGRKKVLLGTIALLFGCSVSSTWSPDWLTLAVLMFVAGFFSGGFIRVKHIYLKEFFLSGKAHELVKKAGSWTFPYTMIVLLGAWTGNWKMLIYFHAAAGVPAFLFLLFIGESPEGLLRKGRIIDARSTFRRIARTNGQTLSTNNATLDVQLNHLVQNANASICDLFEEFGMRTFVLCGLYFCVSVIWNSILFNVDHMSGNLFLNFGVFGAVKEGSDLLTAGSDVVVDRWGLRVSLAIPFMIMTACSTAITLLKTLAPPLVYLPHIIFVCSLGMAVSCSFAWSLINPESNKKLYPREMRKSAYSVCAVFNRLGAILTPWILHWATVWEPWLYVGVAAFSAVAVVFCVCLTFEKDEEDTE